MTALPRRRPRAALTALAALVAWLGVASIAAAQVPSDPVGASVRAMDSAAAAPVNAVASPLTGLVSFLGTKAGAPVPIAALPGDSAAVRAEAFLASYGRAFGIAGASWGRIERITAADDLGTERVRYRQLHLGIPVTAGEMSIQLHGAGVVAVHAKTLVVKEKINPVPSFSAQEASARAAAFVSNHFPGVAATYSEPRLEMFNRGLLESTETPTRLAWFIEAKGENLWQYIWIDAHTGMRLLNFSQLAHALTRQVFDANGTSTLPGTLVRSEGQGPVANNADANFAYDYAGDTYAYYLTQHGRDSINGQGMPIISTVHYCQGGVCPYQNAFWNGVQMVYGPDFASALDVVAHELTHGVTEFSAGLFYYMQSGALNESYSDIFGETVDQLYTPGGKPAGTRWLLGEGLPIGAIRNMADPNASGSGPQPGRLSDPAYFCSLQPLDPSQDDGGVHINSGIPNLAYVLMVDGGSYNGVSVNGIGLVKAGKVQYRALTTYLLSGSNFRDNHLALKQACSDLTPSVVSAAECAEVAKALDAVEMSNPIPCQPIRPTSVPLCPAGQVASTTFFDDLENPASGNWTKVTIAGTSHWFNPGTANPFGIDKFTTSGVVSLWGYDRPTVADSAIGMTNGVVIPAGGKLQFNHSFSFENGVAVAGGQAFYDGGVIEYSANGGPWTDAGFLITGGATYGGTLDTNYTNPLKGKPAFVAQSYGYTASQLSLDPLVGQNVKFRFRIATDDCCDDYGWFIDDIRIYSCVPGVPLFGAVLPASRSVQLGQTATAFAAIVNAGTEAANNVSIGLTTPVPGTLVYRAADGNNNPIAPVNTPVNIPAGGVQNFILAFTPSAPFNPINVAFKMSGANAAPVEPVTGLNTLLLSSLTTPGPDIIALAATATPGLIVDLPGLNGAGAFAVATSNVGAGGSIRVTANSGALPVAVSVCQTGGNGSCLNPPAASVDVVLNAGNTSTFSFFIGGAGFVPFDPANNRLFAIFTNIATGNIVGETSVAVRTLP